MPQDFSETLVLAVSSRALFDMEAEHKLFCQNGLDSFVRRQRELEHVPLAPGPAFPLVRALIALNERGGTKSSPLVEVVMVSSQHPDTGLRVIASIKHHGLDVTRACFTGGAPTQPYLAGFQTDLLLSRSAVDVQGAVDAGIAAAQMYDLPSSWDKQAQEIRFAFDGDAVLFSEESESLYQREGFEAFQANEEKNANVPMPDGPMGKLLRSLGRIRAEVPDGVKTALVTARNAPAHERALRTLRSWGVGVDEAFFLGGLPKGPILKAFRAAIFFDDQHHHVGPASLLVPSGRVPYPSGSVLSAIA